MSALRSRALRVIFVAAAAATFAAVPALGVSPATMNIAICPNGMVPNPAGYGCVPYLPGGNMVGAPSEEVLTRCDGNYYICVWPYPVP